jgi:hypothetical protein
MFTIAGHGDFSLRPTEIRGMDASIGLPAVDLTLMITEICDGLLSARPSRLSLLRRKRRP